MTMGKRKTIISLLKPKDLSALRALYYYRAMDVEQIMTLIYHLDTTTVSGKRIRTIIVNRLSSNGLIQETSGYQPDRNALQITTKGINIVKETTDLQEEIVNDRGDIKRGYYTANELQMKSQFINHQVHTNAFAFAFSNKAAGLPWQYYDEKFVSQFQGMRPDGLLRVAGIDFFIENDMGTESKKQLDEKWQHYRAFFKTDSFKNKENPIKVLFILNGHKTDNARELRKKLVKKSLLDTFSDAITGDFDVLIGSQDELIDQIFNEVIPAQLGKSRRVEILWDLFRKRFKYRLSFGHSFDKVLLGDSYDYYMRQTDHGKIVSQEFFVDDYTTGNLQVLHRVMWFARNQKLFLDKFKRTIKLVVVVNSVEEFYQDLKLIGGKSQYDNDLYVATQASLITAKELYEGLMQIIGDQLLVMDDPTLVNRHSIKSLDINKIEHKGGLINNL